MPDIKWLDEPEQHDYDAAQDYLSLIYSIDTAEFIVCNLMRTEVTKRKAKDILRAAGYLNTPPSKVNSHIKNDLDKVKEGKPLSPILLVQGKGVLHIADGFHRTWAVYLLCEDDPIPCKLV